MSRPLSAVKRRCCLLLSLLPLSAGAAGDYIADIRFEGNDKTRERIMRQELLIDEGDPVNLEAVDESRQALLDLGLFKDVDARIEGDGPAKTVVFAVEERYYILPLPRLDGDLNDVSLSYGIELRLDNLAGLNQRMRINYRNREFSDNKDTQRLFSTTWTYPRMFGTRFDFGLGVGWQEEDVTREEGALEGQYRQDAREYEVALSRWLTDEGPSRGWRTGVGLALEQRGYDYISGAAGLAEDSHAVELNGSVAYLDVRDKLYRREGKAYGYTLAMAASQLGSDEEYSRHQLFYRRYDYLPESGASLYSRLVVGLGFGDRFGGDAFSLGDGDTLRGYEKGFVTGDALLLANVEYLKPIKGYPQGQVVFFADVGNVYSEVSHIDPSNLMAGVGVGLRWRLQAFVDVFLRVEAAYGFEAGSQEFYAGTSVPF